MGQPRWRKKEARERTKKIWIPADHKRGQGGGVWGVDFGRDGVKLFIFRKMIVCDKEAAGGL